MKWAHKFLIGLIGILALSFQASSQVYIRNEDAAVKYGTEGGNNQAASVNRYGYQMMSISPQIVGGLLEYKSLDLDESEEEVKSTQGQIYGWYIFNASQTTRYFKFYNGAAADVTVGVTVPAVTFPLPSGAAANVEISNGLAFTNGISIACTTAAADADTGAPGTGDCIANVFYK